jgi:hypothetical protein
MPENSPTTFTQPAKAAHSRDNAMTNIDGTVGGTTRNNRLTGVRATRERDRLSRLTDLK